MAATASKSSTTTTSGAVATSDPNVQLLPRAPPPPGLRVPSNRKTIYDRNLQRSRGVEASRASFAYLFAEMVVYAQARVTGVQDLERRLADQGYSLGLRLLALLPTRAPPRQPAVRTHRILPLLQFITTTLWRALFNRPADSLERSTTAPTSSDNAASSAASTTASGSASASGSEATGPTSTSSSTTASNHTAGTSQGESLATDYMVADNDPLVNQSISVPKELGALNCGAFVAGIIEGVCDGGGLHARVSAHNAGTDMWPGKTVWLIRFDRDVVEREAIVERAEVSKNR